METEERGRRHAPATLCVHGGWRPSGEEKALVPPVVRSSTFLLDDEALALRAAGRSSEALVYTREGNPTVRAAEARLAALEGADGALLFASGMAAMHALLVAVVRRGDRVVASRELYGGTSELLAELLPLLGAELVRADVTDGSALAAALEGGARLVLCESVSNPVLTVADVRAIAEAARAAGALLAVDATFATPIAQRPLALGADVVHHSASKYLGGHSDLIAGALAARRELLDELWQWRTRAGGCIDPEAAALLDRGMRTLAVRMRAHSENAARVASFLAEHPRVLCVHFPGLPSHPSHEVARRVLDLPSGMVSFVVRGGDEAALAVVRALRLAIEAASLGSVETLASVPATVSHVRLSPEERRAAGVEPGLVRLSVGIEDADDLVADLSRALGERG